MLRRGAREGFPMATHLIVYADDWSTSSAYTHPKDVQDQEAEIEIAA